MCLLFVLMIVVPTIELYLLIQIGQYIGPVNTIALIILTGLTGSILMKMEGWRAWKNLKKELLDGRLPGKRIADGFLILLGGIFLITPGVLTDCLGLLLIFPLTRSFFRERLIEVLKDKIKIHASSIITVYPENTNRDHDDSNVITVYPENTHDDSDQSLRSLSENAREDERRD